MLQPACMTAAVLGMACSQPVWLRAVCWQLQICTCRSLWAAVGLMFVVQVDLTVSSIRPGISLAEMAVLKDRLLQKVAASEAVITVHVSSWEHDTEQGQLLPSGKVDLKVYKFADHRLAFWLDGKDLLEPLLKHTILVQQGFKTEQVAEAREGIERVHSDVQLA